MRLSACLLMTVALMSLSHWLSAAPEQRSSSAALATPAPAHSLEKDDFVQTLQMQALPQLIQSLTEKKTTKRLRVVRVVGDVDDLTASPYLIRAFQEASNEGIRCKILESIGKLHDPALFNWLLLRLKDPSIGIQCFAIWSLGELSTPEARNPLLQRLWDPNRYVRMSAIDALGKTGQNTVSASELTLFLDDEDVQIRFLAAKALEGVAGPDAVSDLFKHLMNEPSLDVQEVLASALGQTGDVAAASRFIELLKNPFSQATEHWAEVGLKSAEPSVVVPALAPLIDGDDFRLKVSALRILGEIQIPTRRDDNAVWINKIRRWAEGPDLIARETAARLLERIKLTELSSEGYRPR